jgi:hypothetical protein
MAQAVSVVTIPMEVFREAFYRLKTAEITTDDRMSNVFIAKFAVITWASVVCRLLPPAKHFSVSPLEKTDAQIQLTRG